MPTILDLFKNQEKDLYDNEIFRIESRGLVNPPRAAALIASSPESVSDLIGGQLAGIIGGSANRPSDTIYKGKKFTDKPVSITGVTEGLLQSSVEVGTNYYVKREPSGIPGFGPLPPVGRALAQGGSSATGVATNLAVQGINKIGSKKAINSLSQNLKKDKQSVYGPVDGKPPEDTITNSTYKETYSQLINPRTGRQEYVSTELIKREGKFKWDDGNSFLLKRDSFADGAAYKDDFESKYKDTNQVPILFKRYGNKEIIPFVGTIGSISEDISPEWSGFQYVGSPFKNYRYGGVERSLKFNLKLYYFELLERTTMIKKINYLKSLAFPYNEVSQIKYTDSDSAQYAFSPNLVYVTIGELYKNMFGYIESLSFSIQDSVTWANFDNGGSKDTTAYPSIIDVSIGLKIIENHKSEKSDTGTVTYKYNFDGRGNEFIKETRESNAKAATTDAGGNSQNTTTTPTTTPQEPQFQQGQLNNFTGANGGGYNNMQR